MSKNKRRRKNMDDDNIQQMCKIKANGEKKWMTREEKRVNKKW